MTKINLFMNILFLLIAIILCAIPRCLSALSDKQLCYDPKCSVPVSLATATLGYQSNDPEVMSFHRMVNVTVYSKEAGSRLDLWGVEINGKRGYAPKQFLQEYKILKKNLTHEVPTGKFNEGGNKAQVFKDSKPKENDALHLSSKDNEKSSSTNADISMIKSADESVKQSVVNTPDISPTYKVIEGTTIHFENNETTLEPSSVTQSVQATAVISEQSSENITLNTNSPTEKLDSGQNEIPDVSSDETKEILESSKLKNNEVLDEAQTTAPLLDINTSNNLPDTDHKSDGNQANKNDSEGVKESSESNNSYPQKSTEKEKEKFKRSHVKKVKAGDKTENNVDLLGRILSEKVKKQEVESQEKENNNEQIPKTSESRLEKVEESVANIDVKVIESQKIVDEGSVLDKKEVPKNEETEKEIPVDILKNSSNKVPDTSVQEEVEETFNVSIGSIRLSAENNFSSGQDHIGVNPIDANEELTKVEKKEKTETNNNTFIEETVLDTSNIVDVNKDLQETTTNNQTFIEETVSDTSNEVNVNKDLQETITKNEIFRQETVSDTSNKVDVNKDLQETITKNETFREETVSDTSNETDVNKDLQETITNNQIFIEGTVSDTSNKVDVNKDLQETIASGIDPIDNREIIVNNTVNSNNNLLNDISSVDVPKETIEFSKDVSDKINLQEQEQLDSSQINVITEQISNLKEFQHNRNLLNVEENVEIENTGHDVKSTVISITESLNSEALPKYGDNISDEDKVSYTSTDSNDIIETEEIISSNVVYDMEGSSDVCMTDGDCEKSDIEKDHEFLQEDENSEEEEKTIMTRVKMKQNYWETFMYLGVTAFTALFFSLGYYFIENKRRDGELIAKINKLEKELLVSMKECTILSESLKTTKEKLNSIEDESFGSNEMVLSLKADLEVSQNAKAELEDQVVMLEKDLESATEAGLELERMLREFLASNNEVNPLAQSVEDLQIRLNVQQAANESLTNALNLKTQENESLSADLASMKQKFEELEVELMQVSEKLKAEVNLKTTLEHTSTDKIQQLEFQIEQLSLEKLALQKDLKGKIAEVEDLAEVVNQVNSNNIDLNKLYDVSHIKAEATQLLEERNELKVQLSEVEGAHHLLEEHMKLIKEEIATLSDQCKQAEKEKKDAETRLEVLSNFFKEKETQRQKEEAIWLQKQGEVMSTVERIQTLQNELQNYKQQIEMLKREIVDQEREYKSQISLLETKAHEQWVVARQNERRLEESKTEAAQLRNRLTMIEKNLNEADPDAKLHRLEANGETATSPPLFIGAESSSSPIMFTGSSGVPPPPPPSYMHCSMFPPYLPPPLPSGSGVPPYDVGQRPPPLGGRLSSPPPMPLHPPASSRYDNASSPPPPMSPHLLPPFNRHRSPPPPFGNDHIHPPPPPPPGSILPPPRGTSHSWGEESLPPLRNSGFHPHQREQRARNHKGSLHSSGESLDKTHHSGKV